MAEHMITIRNVISLCLLLLTMSVAAEVLVDPTRPPAALNPALANVSAENAGPVLQSVLISRGRKVAIISGKEVRVNEKFGDARVVKITETEVVLRNGKEMQTLKLFPEMNKRTAQRASKKNVDKRQ
jgi:MSHA biogenesis protein MshK